MNSEELFNQIRLKQSFLCVGLDTEMEKIPDHMKKNDLPLFAFNREIIDATHDLAIAYKPNVAFYESAGTSGWIQLEHTVRYIRENYPDLFIIADAKRGDIGNTSRKYADAFFREMDCDAVTVAPYMGSDSVLPFLHYEKKWVILLALTSNKGADDFQFQRSGDHEPLFETVLRKSMDWGNSNNMMYVVGATRASMLLKVREIVPDHFLLVPGVGAQGGDLAEVAKYGMNARCGLLVNSSRAIIYADDSLRFAEEARLKAQEAQVDMGRLLKQRLGDTRP
jgi:orotidine-5'-phosphate decarboxylase